MDRLILGCQSSDIDYRRTCTTKIGIFDRTDNERSVIDTLKDSNCRKSFEAAERSHATLAFIENENRTAPLGYRVIFLGDIIDRGPDSKRAMDLVVAELDRRLESRLILGNHEAFLLLFLDRPDERDLVFDHWMSNGGLAAAVSYGLDAARPYLRIGDAHDFGRMVVHGHTETTSGRPEVYGNRIALDTAACASGVLSTLVIEKNRENLFFATKPAENGTEVLSVSYPR